MAKFKYTRYKIDITQLGTGNKATFFEDSLEEAKRIALAIDVDDYKITELVLESKKVLFDNTKGKLVG